MYVDFLHFYLLLSYTFIFRQTSSISCKLILITTYCRLSEYTTFKSFLEMVDYLFVSAKLFIYLFSGIFGVNGEVKIYLSLSFSLQI